ncbi:hypothetical protein EC988_000086 [Linderina pennispora]|nr:hypothetical protein EC988_000086 [Linderina pennispora]
MSVQVGAAIERKINDAMVSLDNTARRWQMESLSLVTGLAEVKGMVKDLQASVETLSAAGSKSSNRATMPLLPPLPFEMGQAQLMPMLLNNDGILAAPNLQPPMGVELPPQMAPMAQAQQAGMCGGHGHSVNSLTLVHPVTDQNTPARTRVFSMRDAIAVVDSAYPYELDDGWPVAPASGNKRPKAQR